MNKLTVCNSLVIFIYCEHLPAGKVIPEAVVIMAHGQTNFFSFPHTHLSWEEVHTLHPVVPPLCKQNNYQTKSNNPSEVRYDTVNHPFTLTGHSLGSA